VMALGREFRNILANTHSPQLQELVSKEFTFEDFKRQAVTFTLGKTRSAEAAAGVFQ